MNDKWLAFGAWLQQEREKAGVSQGKVSKGTPIHVVQLSKVENGHSGISPAKLEEVVATINKLSTGYQIDLATAFRKAGFIPANDETEGLFSGIEKLSPDMQRLAKAQIRAIIDSLIEQDNLDTDYISDEEINTKDGVSR